MRNNGGGLLEDAVQIASLFVPRGTEILRTRGREAEERIYKTTVNPIAPSCLWCPCQRPDSPSSEILAGAMQDPTAVGRWLAHLRQRPCAEHAPLPYGDIIMKLTTARYYIPSGRPIQAPQLQRTQRRRQPQTHPRQPHPRHTAPPQDEPYATVAASPPTSP